VGDLGGGSGGEAVVAVRDGVLVRGGHARSENSEREHAGDDADETRTHGRVPPVSTLE
jgi:hypothetical protein